MTSRCLQVVLQGPGPCDKQVTVDLGAFRLLHEGLVQVSECCMWSTLPEKVLRLPDDGDADADYNDQHKNSGSGVGDDDEKNVEEEDEDDDEKDT